MVTVDTMIGLAVLGIVALSGTPASAIDGCAGRLFIRKDVMEQGWLTTKEAAAIIGCSRENITKHINKPNGLPAVRMGRDFMVRESVLLAYFKDVKPRGTPRGGRE